MDQAVTALNYQLDDILVEETSRFTVEDLSSSTLNFLKTVKSLLDVLAFYDRSINPALVTDTSSIADIYNALGNIQPHFRMENDSVRYRIVHFLCTTIQAERLMQHAFEATSRCECMYLCLYA